MDNMYRLLVPFIFMLLSSVSGKPFQCEELENAIPKCPCEARIFKGLVYNADVVINCRNLNISVLPKMGSSNYVIYEMTFAQNNIQTIPAAAFNGLRIQRLDLSKNRLTDIHDNSFQGLENDLKELNLGAEKGANVRFPNGSLINLNLKTLHLEYFTFPQNELEPGFLNLLTDLTSLTLSYNQLSFIDHMALPRDLTSLTLDHQSLSSFPIDALETLIKLESLTITNTAIPAVYGQAMEMNTRLKELDLGYNDIRILGDKCFEGITTSLLTLSLRNNPLPSWTSLNEIKQLTALTTLQLSEITLSTLPPTANFLLNKESLTTLHLEGNALETLGSNVFSNLGNLEHLNLARNQIANWDDQVFAGLSSLKHLDLANQTLGNSFLLPESLTTLSSLETLKLSKNHFSPPNLWSRISHLSSLKILLLDGTKLTSIPDHAFRNLSQLEELNLDYNNLEEITQKMMVGPRNLQKLEMTSNKIKKISHCAFHGYNIPLFLSIGLINNPLTCDCKLRWLLEARDAGNISLTGAEQCGSPPDKLNIYLLSLKPAELTCISAQPDEPCLELYPTTASPVTTTPLLNPIFDLQITNVSKTSITLQWTTTAGAADVSYFQILHMDLEVTESTGIRSKEIDPVETSFTVRGLKSNTKYSVCVLAFYPFNDRAPNPPCRTARTLSTAADEPEESKEIGIIIGTIVAVLVLLAIIAAIVYLVCWRKRRNSDVPPQPHVFTASELPSMTANSRQFTKPKKPPPKVGRALDENVKVTVISDGQTDPISPRHSVGSYQFLDEKHPNPNPDLSAYTNDVDSRPLPTAPDMSLKGYYNGEVGGVQSSHMYNEIDHK